MTDVLGIDGQDGFSPPSSETLRRLQSAMRPADTTLPYLPPAQPVAPIVVPDAGFDPVTGLALQNSQGSAFGTAPAGAGDGSDASRKLREQANRKKRRGKAFGRLLLVLLLAALGVGGYFGYQKYQESKDDAVEEVDPDVASAEAEGDASADADTDGDASADTDASADADGAGATPVGEVADGLAAQDALNDTPRQSVGGFLGAIDGARDAVADVNGDAAAAPQQGPVPAVGPVIANDITPIVLQTVAQQLSDEGGFERYIIDAAAFETANVGAFNRFVEVVAAQPIVESDAFALLPGLVAEEIGLAVERTDGELTRVVVVTADRSVAVDVTVQP